MRKHTLVLAAAGMLTLASGAFANIAPGPRPRRPILEPTSQPTTDRSPTTNKSPTTNRAPSGTRASGSAVIGLGAAAALVGGGLCLSRRRR